MNVRTLKRKKIIDEAVKNSSRLTEELRGLLVYKEIVTGQGLEFDRLREYDPGDEARMIDWNSLARTNKLYTKVFKEERLMDTVIVHDLSSSMATGTTEIVKNEYSSVVSTSLSQTALDAGDKTGFLGFSEGIRANIPVSYNDEIPFEIADQLSNPEIYGGKVDWKKLENHLLENFESDTYIFLVTDFMPFNDELITFLKKISSIFRGVFGIMVRDPLDSKLPEGVGKAYMTDPETGENMLVDVDEIRDGYIEESKRKEEKIKTVLETSGGQFFKTYTDEDFIYNFATFLDRRMELWS